MSEALIKQLWASDAASALTNEAARRIETQNKLIEEMREALESAKEELYYISHSSCDPNDEKNMDSVACAYRDCRNALSKAKLTT